jgi:hypothetical protein
MQVQFKRFFSTDSAKAIKAQSYGWLNAINYMAPHRAAGVGNVCPHASAGCIALCLGLWSGQASMIRRDTGTNAVRKSREAKAQAFMQDRQSFMLEMAFHIAKLYRYARQRKMRLCVRPNGSSDIAYEGIRFFVSPDFATMLSKITGKKIPDGLQTIFGLFPWIQFVDYTKNPKRFDRELPANYYLTFSRSEANDSEALNLLGRGINVAAVFRNVPKKWNGFRVLDGDKHDLRHLDRRGGFVVGLTPKGWKAKRDQSGFVI